MYLKRIEVKGFKSFADRVELELNTGITGVVGPNGSGKSNIADAVRWVLGEQSARSLRGMKMEDVIFGGTNIRKPLGFAEVSIAIDNSDNMLPVDYTEVIVTRRMYRSGESEYFINKTSCRLRDITELFMDTGVGRDGYSIIGQGRIDEILNTRAEDRREIFEEAAGIVKYKSRKQEAEKRMDSTEQNIIRINDIINELEAQLEPLNEQSIRARRYLDLREKLKTLEINIFIRNMDKTKEKLAALADNTMNLENELVENSRRNARLEDEYSKARLSLQNIEQNIEQIQNELYKAENDRERLQGEANVLSEKESSVQKNISRLEEESTTENENISALLKTLEENKNSINNLKSILENHQAALQSKEKTLQDINSSISEKENHIEGMKADSIEIFNKAAEKKSSINSYNTFRNGIEKRKSQIISEKSDRNNRITELEQKIQEQLKEKDLQTEGVRINEIKINELNEVRTDIIGQKNLSDRAIYELNGKIQSRQARYRILGEMENEFEGYNKSVKEIMRIKAADKTLSSRICGVVADLIHVPEKYEIAIESALGSALQNIVTEDEYVAKKCIEFLKVNKLGRATFLPLTTISGRNISNLDRKASACRGFLGFANDLVAFDEKYRNIISSLLARDIIMDNMDNAIVAARSINYSMKIVTLDGDIINPGGAFTGGSINQKTGRILGRKRELEELEKELGELKDSLSLMENKKSSIESKLIELENDIRLLNEQKHEIEMILSSCTANINISNAERDRNISDLKSLNFELKQLEEEDAEALIKIDHEAKSLSELENESNKLAESLQSEQSDIKDILFYKEELISEITSLKVGIAEVKQGIESVNGKIIEIEMDIKKFSDSVKVKEEEIIKEMEQITDIVNAMKEILSSSENLAKIKEKLSAQLSELGISKRDNAVSLNDMEEKIKEYGQLSSNLQSELHKLEMQKTRLDIEMENLQNNMWEDYELSYASAQKYKMQIDNLAQVSRDIALIKDEIRELGIVNVGAIDEYKKVKERYEFLLKQKNDLEEAKNALLIVIDEMTEKMKAQFATNFAIINENFNSTFQQLFGGGRAQLVLCNEEDILSSGIEIVVEPPGKKLQSLTLMSGGEKALTAIALLFGILKMKPSPFCILDEIEAALDDLNVVRYASFLKELSHQTQFITITHRKGTMEIADVLYGVTMEEKGVSRLVSVKLTERAS